VDGRESPYGFHFHDDLIFDDQVDPRGQLEHAALIDDRE
jgi:hypothetical protein